jgi:hypothetical protein
MTNRIWDSYDYDTIWREGRDLHKQAQAKPSELTDENDQLEYWIGWAAHNAAMAHAYKFEFLFQQADESAKRLGTKWKETTEDNARLAEFARWVIQQGWRYCEVQDADIHEKAVELGLVVPVPYDPAKHGPSEFDLPPGDDLYVFAPMLSTAVAQIERETPAVSSRAGATGRGSAAPPAAGSNAETRAILANTLNGSR